MCVCVCLCVCVCVCVCVCSLLFLKRGFNFFKSFIHKNLMLSATFLFFFYFSGNKFVCVCVRAYLRVYMCLFVCFN